MSQANQTKVTAVIPVKALTDAKSRLGAILDPAARRELVLDMLGHVLGAVRRSGVSRILVVTPDATVQSVVAAQGVNWVPDPAQSLNASLGHVFHRCWERQETPLYLPADLPRLDESDVHALLDAGADEQAVVLAPSWDGEGTNALLVPAAGRLEPRLGKRSFARHLARAASLGIATRVHHAAGIGLDIDTPEDLLLLAGPPPKSPEVHAR